MRWLKDHAIILGILILLWVGIIAMSDGPYSEARDLPEDRVAHELNELQELIGEALQNWDCEPMRSRLEYSKAVQLHAGQLTILVKSALEQVE